MGIQKEGAIDQQRSSEFRTYEPDGEFLSKRVEVKRSEHGRGVFAAESIALGEQIWSFKGPYTSQQEASAYSLQVSIEPSVFLETDSKHIYENFINHTCTSISETEESLDEKRHGPNCKIVINIRRDKHSLIGSESVLGEVTLVALRDIKPGEQLFFDYAMTEVNMSEAGGDFICTCGSPSCRCQDGNPLVGADKLTLTEAKYLLRHGLLTDHVVAYLLDKWGVEELLRREQV